MIFGYFWRKFIGLSLSKMVDFGLFLKKIHRVILIENGWFLAIFEENSYGYLYRKWLIFRYFSRKFIGLLLSEIADFLANFEENSYGYPYRKWFISGYFWRKFIGLALSKIADFWLILNKIHRVAPIENGWFLHIFEENS